MEVLGESQAKVKGGGPKERFPLGTQFLVVAASRSHYPLRTVTSLGCHKQPERLKEQNWGSIKKPEA